MPYALSGSNRNKPFILSCTYEGDERTTNSEILNSLKSIDDNLKFQHKQRLKYLSSFRDKTGIGIQFETDRTLVVPTCKFVDVFVKHFQ
jgi:hypothetical protein